MTSARLMRCYWEGGFLSDCLEPNSLQVAGLSAAACRLIIERINFRARFTRNGLNLVTKTFLVFPEAYVTSQLSKR